MATNFKPSSASLFNNATLSDVIIKQIYKGKFREYYAHKAILCKESEYFLKAFTSNFKEATESTMELHDDDPELFELALKFIYTEHYDTETITKLANQDNTTRVRFPIELYSIADKYAIAILYHPICDDLQTVLQHQTKSDFKALATSIEACFNIVRHVDTPLGTLVTAFVMKDHLTFTATTQFKDLMKQFPVFGTEVALSCSALLPYGQYVQLGKCNRCYKIGVYDFIDIPTSGLIYSKTCKHCGVERQITIIPEVS